VIQPVVAAVPVVTAVEVVGATEVVVVVEVVDVVEVVGAVVVGVEVVVPADVVVVVADELEPPEHAANTEPAIASPTSARIVDVLRSAVDTLRRDGAEVGGGSGDIRLILPLLVGDLFARSASLRKGHPISETYAPGPSARIGGPPSSVLDF